VRLQEGKERLAARNAATMMPEPGFWEQLRASASVADYRKLFLRNYETIRQVCLGFGQLGVAVIAIDKQRRRVAGSLCLAARVGSPSFAIIGRHGRADLYLDGDDSLSLRHLAVIVHPPKTWDPQRLTMSLLDLRSSHQFTSEHGERLEGLVAEGSVFVECGRYALLCLTTGDSTDWPESAAHAWEVIPERHYIDAQAAGTNRSPQQHMWAAGVARDASFGRGGLRRTCVTLVDGPLMAQALLLEPGEALAGYLTATSGGRARMVPVGVRALQRGVLIGRDERCDQHDLLCDPHISRVHVLLRQVGDGLLAVDLASTGGTALPSGGRLWPVRMVRITGPADLALALGRAHIRWQPMAASPP